jgi:hypothetical protein
MSNEMIPFGKHKGKPVEAILDDRKYMDWLLAQSWFKENHLNLYTVIINNGQEPTDTPEHNAMQIRFLDEEFRLKFALAAKGESIFEFTTNEAVRKVTDEAARIREGVIAEFNEKFEVSFNSKIVDYKERSEHYQEQISKCEKCNGQPRENCYHPRPDLPVKSVHSVPEISVAGVFERRSNGGYWRTNKLLICSQPEFEVNGMDVGFTLTTGFSFTPSELKPLGSASFDYGTKTVALPDRVKEHGFTVEIKPSVGDDYPSVLRQMNHNKSKYLLLRAYTGIGATQEQFKDFFKSQGKIVVFEREVDIAALPKFDREIVQP